VRESRALVLKGTTRLSLVHVTRADNTDLRKVGWSGSQRCQEPRKEDIFHDSWIEKRCHGDWQRCASFTRSLRRLGPVSRFVSRSITSSSAASARTYSRYKAIRWKIGHECCSRRCTMCCTVALFSRTMRSAASRTAETSPPLNSWGPCWAPSSIAGRQMYE
jgi:hypothetical protein